MVRGKEYNKREWLEERKTINMIGYRKWVYQTWLLRGKGYNKSDWLEERGNKSDCLNERRKGVIKVIG